MVKTLFNKSEWRFLHSEWRFLHSEWRKVSGTQFTDNVQKKVENASQKFERRNLHSEWRNLHSLFFEKRFASVFSKKEAFFTSKVVEKRLFIFFEWR